MPATRKIVRKKPPSRSAGDGRAERAPTGDSLNAYIREISKFKPLSADDEKVLGRRIQQGDQEALQRLVEANLRFVVSYAKRYRGWASPSSTSSTRGASASSRRPSGSTPSAT